MFVDFEHLVLGAVKELPDQANPAPYEALTRLCRGYGNASVRRAYADWANPLFGGHQEDLAMNGVDLIQVARVGIQNKNAADIRMAVDAMETLIVHPEVSVFILVSGDGDYSPLVQRLREFGKWVVGVGTEANASRKLVSVCSEYKYWGTLVTEVEPAARPVAAFDITEAERLLVRALEESGVETMTAPASATCCAIVSCASPVPGGMSTIMMSSSPQATSRSICWSAPITIGPRQIIGVSSGTRKPIDMHLMP